MLKLIGAVLIVFAGTMIGFYQASQFASRPKQIRQLIQALRLLETEILFGFTPLPDALSKIGGQMATPVSALFNGAAQELIDHKGSTTMDAWQMAVSEHWNKTSMKTSEQEIMRQLGFSLGITDREDQIKHLNLAVTQLQSEEENAREDQKRYEKMWKSLGVLAGALIVILMY